MPGSSDLTAQMRHQSKISNDWIEILNAMSAFSP